MGTRRILGIVVFAVLCSVSAWSQPELGECDQTVDEMAASQLPKALKNWRAKNYREAERYLKKAVDMDPNYADALYLLGDLYVKKGMIDKAEGLWLKLLEVCPEYMAEVKYYVGVILLENGEREQAIALFESFLKDPSRDRGYDKECRAALREARLKNDLLTNQVEFNPVPLRPLCTQEDEYLATISPDQQTIYFTRKAKEVNLKDGPAVRIKMVERFTKSTRNDNGSFGVGELMPSPFNESFNEGGPSITGDNCELYFTVCTDIKGYTNCDVYYCDRDAYGYWTTPRSVGDHINLRDAWESQPTVSANGDELYFVSNRKGGIGGLDIYKCTRLPNGRWSKPKNLGRDVNTRENEKTPFIHPDGQSLYIASNGIEGLGEYDLWMYQKETDSTWMPPENAGYPMNDNKNNIGLMVSLNGQNGYMASKKFKPLNGYDLFTFPLPERIKPQPVVLVTGRLLKDDLNPAEGVKLVLKNLSSGGMDTLGVNQATGNYARALAANDNEEFLLYLSHPNYAFSSVYITKMQADEYGVVESKIRALELGMDKSFAINDVVFGPGQAYLNAASVRALNAFATYLIKNPDMKIEIESHSSPSEGGDAKSISKERAKSVYNHLQSVGVPSSQITFKGYGASRPLVLKEGEEGSQQRISYRLR